MSTPQQHLDALRQAIEFLLDLAIARHFPGNVIALKTDAAGNVVHQIDCQVGRAMPAPGGNQSLSATTVTIMRTCPAHPAEVLDACPGCFRVARTRVRKLKAALARVRAQVNARQAKAHRRRKGKGSA